MADGGAGRTAPDGDNVEGLAEHLKARKAAAATEDALALRFTQRHADELVYVAIWGRWLKWSDGRWQHENTLEVFDLARRIVRETPLANKDARTVAAVEHLARADRRHARSVDVFDVDPDLLNTPSGIVDLRSGLVTANDPAQYMTRITATAPGGDCPLWRAFLAKVTAGNDGLADFLQRVAGYSLTGVTTEHALFFFYGTGGNGKGVFLNTLSAVLGDYASVAPAETLMATRSDRHSTDVAGLRGARFVTAQEVADNRDWDEARIKSLTGGDPVPARYMRQDYFRFTPAFKLAIAGNHKPRLRTVDEAIRRRFHLIPFTTTILEADRDKNLAEKLRPEWPGILRWAIDGALEWRRVGLAPPPCVRDATDNYFEVEDTTSQWLAECCDVGDPARYKADNSDIFNSWKVWCQQVGEPPGSSRALFEKLEQRGFERFVTSGKRGFKGLSIKEPPASERDWKTRANRG